MFRTVTRSTSGLNPDVRVLAMLGARGSHLAAAVSSEKEKAAMTAA